MSTKKPTPDEQPPTPDEADVDEVTADELAEGVDINDFAADEQPAPGVDAADEFDGPVTYTEPSTPEDLAVIGLGSIAQALGVQLADVTSLRVYAMGGSFRFDLTMLSQARLPVGRSMTVIR